MTMLRRLALLAVLAPALAGQVVINEVVYDDQSTDDREFIELYNAGPGAVDISGWTIENRDNAGVSLMGVVAVPAGTILPPGGFYVFGNAGVPNVNQVIPINSLENDSEICVLRDPMGNVMDSLAYENQQQLAFGVPVEGHGHWGAMVSNDAFPQSISRWFDGLDTNNNGRDFGLLPATPGTTNNLPSVLPLADSFDAYLVGAPVPGWGYSFVPPIVIDPTVLSPHNLAVIPASPQGGNAMTVIDPTGGGDIAILTTTPVSDVDLEAWVYMDTTNAGIDYEAWTIGVRGTIDTFANWIPPLPSTQCTPGSVVLGPANPAGASSVTGVCWNYTWANGMGLLRLIDAGGGGPDLKVLASIVVTPGVNDGWQRLRLNVAGDVIEANFGGIYGVPGSGTRVLALTGTTGVGSIYVGYRECVLVNNPNIRGPVIDQLTIVPGTVPFSAFLTQPAGSGSVQLDNRGLVPGNETWNIVSLEPCPGGSGTGPYLGLCASDFNSLLDQFLLPAGTLPFHFFPAAPNFSFGPLLGLPVGLPIDVVTFDVVGGNFNNIAAVASIVLQ
jgi:hypothetical protein